jgi:transposase
MEKTDARKLKPEAQHELRNQAIRLRKKKMKYHEIAEILEIYPTTVGRWYRAHKKEGPKAIKLKIRGRRTGACRTLSPEQEKQIQKAIDQTNSNCLLLCGRDKLFSS